MPIPADIIEAVNADDAARVAEIVAADPSAAMARDPAGVSAIMLSRYRFARPVTDALLAVDPDLDVYESATLGYLDRLRQCLDDDGTLATAYSPDGFTALHLTAFFGKPEAARILLLAGADPNAWSRNDFGVQPLHSAVAGRHSEVCRLLVTAGASVDTHQRDGFTPLHAAAQHGDDELVEFLLSAGADPTAITDDGATPSDTAEAAGHVDVARRLREVAEARG